MKAVPVAASALVVLAVLWMAGCGGGSSASTPPSLPPPPLQITTQSLPKALVNQAYSAKLQASGGVPPYRWNSQLGVPGLALATDGTLSGSPTVSSDFFPLISVSDSKGVSISGNFELDVVGPLAFLNGPALPDSNVALPVFNPISATGGVPPYTFSLTSGSLPPGISFSSQISGALINGTPTVPGNYSFTVQVTDNFTPPLSASATFTLRVLNNLVFPNTTMPDAVENIPYSEFMQPAGGTPPYHFGLGQNSALPVGLQFDANTGRIFGTPTTSPVQDFVLVTISDSASPPATGTFSIAINVAPPLTIQTSSLPDTARGLGYFGSVNLIGGRGPYHLQISSGALPGGLSIPSTINSFLFGTSFNVNGMSTTDGLFLFTLEVSDSYETPNVAKRDFQIRVSEPLSISGPGFTNILYNQSFTGSFPASGGFPPYTWTMNPVPPGFTFDPSTGTLSGTPSASGQTNVNVTVWDSSNPPLFATFFTFALLVTPKLSIMTSDLPPVAIGRKLLLEPFVIGGAAPYQWSVTGTLPPGVSLSPVDFGDSAFAGTATTAGTYNFTLNISDGNTGTLHQSASQSLSWTVKDPGQMTRNDSIGSATPVSNIMLLGSISPASDPSAAGADVDVYSASAAPGTLVSVYIASNNDFVQPPEPNSLFAAMEIVDGSGNRYQSCGLPVFPVPPDQVFNSPCISDLPGTNVLHQNFFVFQVPGTGATPVSFYVRVFDERGDARPDFIYTFSILNLN
jgi:large repetitive protein